ncbi:chain length determinant protein tyrosine kinase EpsG [Dechloromonas sp. HYN0024]|uniref:chain length determinant protein tyrosine kinase EpsG n=1 Tax=Dechloromonas sp. HYN0024 TaxID=2231055 RepID=UPI000E4537C6|nr:chain length determinant protein tyrosine kinase EpsG [Dechloromonas sp. HYN0024]AXS80105.1 chain length determinant protein tyrosine kinase EpsG [Dechloromonas sp. HYN0024]
MNFASTPESVITRAAPYAISGGSIGAILMDIGRLTPEAAERILKLQKESGLRFGDAAIKLGLLTEMDVRFALSRQFDYPNLAPGDKSVSEEVVAAFKPYSPAVERLRALRSQLMLRCFDLDAENRSEKHCLAIVSPEQGEGRSYLAANLAVVFSQLGERTLLIDADLRQPRQHELFCLGNHAGLSAVLSGRANMDDAIHRIPNLLGLSVMPAGAIPPNPQELLSRLAFGNLLNDARERFDIVLIDTPDASRSADVETIATRAGAALAVSRKHFTSTRRLQLLVDSLRQAGSPVVGVVLNEF